MCYNVFVFKMATKSIIIKGEIGKDGCASAFLANSRDLTVNTWEFCIQSLVIEAVSVDVNDFYELGVSFHTSEQFDYSRGHILERFTPNAILPISVKKGEKQYLNLHQDSKWLKIQEARETVQISLYKIGSSEAFPVKSLLLTAHVWIRRLQ